MPTWNLWRAVLLRISSTANLCHHQDKSCLMASLLTLPTFTNAIVISDFSLKTMTTITATLSSVVFGCASAACRPLYYSRHTQFTQQENTILGPNSIELGRNHKLIELRWRWRIRQLNQPSSQPASCQSASVWDDTRTHTHFIVHNTVSTYNINTTHT